MPPLPLLLILVLLFGGGYVPGTRGDSPGEAGPAPGSAPVPGSLPELRGVPRAPTAAPGVRLGLQRRPLPFPVEITRAPPLLRVLAGRGELSEPPSTLRSWLPQLPRVVGTGAGLPGMPAPVGSPEVPPGARSVAVSAGDSVRQDPPSFFDSEFADLSVHLRGRGEFGGDWTRFRPCEVGLQTTCDPGLVPELKPEVQFGIQVAGTIAQRIHVDVDYDEAREFSAANNVNIHYQGLEGELVQRVEVGDVTLSFPESRFLTRGIPAGNFGFRTLSAMGPLDVQTVWAQQSGDVTFREFQLSGVGDRQAFIQEDTLVLDDADYLRGQFFFLLDPASLRGYPHVDVLSLDPGAAPPSLAPGAGLIQLYRFENEPVTRQQVEGYIQAEAVAEAGGVRVAESGWFRNLQPEVDYLLHPSGLWVALRRPLRHDEMLAVTYVTATGDTVGDYNPERIHNAGGRPSLRLLKASGPRHQPSSPTWEMEMHQVYRISGSDDVEPASVSLTISLGELSGGRTFKRRPTGEEMTLLKLMGLDEESPADELDPSFVYRPAQDFFMERPPVSGTFLVFSTLRPFADPPPVPSLGLSAHETREILGADANAVIYESPDPVRRDNGGLFRLTIGFRIRSEDLISTFSLGALGIRDGSERIHFEGRLLRRGEDYLIDYDVGQVTLLAPEALFGADPRGRIRAQWEQKALFQIAPTSIFGLNARYAVGERGAVHLLGLHQREGTLQNRPQLGMEPSSILHGGLNADLNFDATWLDRFAGRLPGTGSDTPATLSLKGELALSVPNPNTGRHVYLDDFDATDELSLSLLARDWYLGSAPQELGGTEDVLPPVLAPENAAGLVWQHTWILQGPTGDSLGVFEGFFPRRDIDREIAIAGTEIRQTGLRLTFGEGPVAVPGPDAPGWRSITTVLSNTGTDLTRSDYLEFYAAGGEDLTLILDLGRVSEDAFFMDREGRTSGIHPETGEPWGLGILDQEADPRRGEIWNDALDRRGMWPEECLVRRGQIFTLAHPDANCTRGNGRSDTEDLDGDGILTTEDRVYRYVVRLDGSSPYLVRTTQETGTPFQLYRIPLRGPLALNVGGRVTEADWRAVRHLRLTVAGTASQGVSLTRLRLLGSRWVKRGEEGVLTGLAGEIQGVGGGVEVVSVSALSEGAGYQSPPGVLEQLDDPTQAFGARGVEFNEKSLAIQVRDLGPGERAEVYHRFPQRPRNFLTYRQARIWGLGREGDWGPGGAEFFVKVGSDPENFYLYRTDRPTAPPGEGVASSDWLPEVVVDFEEWLSLRRRAEEKLILNPPPAGAPPVEVWSSDSTHAVFLRDRARAPNLAAVRELSMGIRNPTDAPLHATTVWVNEFRLSRAQRDVGYAGYVDLELEASRFLRTSVSYSGQGPFFRQLSGEPTYQDDATLSVHSTLDVGRAMPEEWGIDLPVTVAHTRMSQDPTFLSQSDVRAGGLTGLRETGMRETRVEVGLRKLTPVGNRALDPVLDGLSLRAGYSRNQVSTTTLESASSGMDARADYVRELDVRELPLIPEALEGVVRTLLPRGMEEALLGTRLRWAPERIRLGTFYSRREREAYRFEQILAMPGDNLVTPTLSPREALETTAHVSFRPLTPLTAEVSFFSIRDLLDPRDVIRNPGVQRLLEEERWRAGFLDMGWETNRNLHTRFGFRPTLAAWLRTDFTMGTEYLTDRNPALVEEMILGPDTLFLLQRNASGSRNTRGTVSVELEGLARALSGRGVEGEGERSALLFRFLGAVDPLFVSRQGGIAARFFRDTVNPGAGFQLGWGDRDAFRFLGGDTASVLTGRMTWTAASGARLPMNLRLTANYSDSRTEILHLRSDRDVRNRVWPDLRLTVPQVSLPQAAEGFLESLSLSSGYRRTFMETDYGGLSLQRRTGEERQIPLDVSITWVGQVTTRYRGSYTEGEGKDPTGDTRTRRQSHSFLLSSVVPDPPLVGGRLDAPLRVSVGYQYSSQLTCRTPQGLMDCTPFVDFLSRSLNLTLDSVISPMAVGLHLTYTDRRSFVGRHDGIAQFQFGLFGQFLFDSGIFVPPVGTVRNGGL